MADKIPEWLGTALVGAVFGVLGFLSKALWDWRTKILKQRAETVGNLQRLKSLLDASKAVFEVQQAVLHELMNRLEARHKDLFRIEGGYEENISRCYSVMDEKEKELHGIIRTYTENSMKTLNEEMLAWLKTDMVFKNGLVPLTRQSELAGRLFALEIHLTLWHAKYKVWMPGHPDHALVYMEDENQHGLGFPSEAMVEQNGQIIKRPGVDEEVAGAVTELRRQ